MKKKMAALVLAMVIVGMTAGCGNKADDSKEKEGTKTEADNAEDSETEQEFVLTNKDGKVVTIDEKDMTKYITLGAYKNLEIEAPAKAVVTDENVNTFIMQQIVAKPEEQIEVTEDRAIQKYDTANIDYAGYKDGVAFDGGTAEGADLNIGFGGFIDGFEDGLIGHKKGEEVTLDLTFRKIMEIQNLPDRQFSLR